ncbi:MULTISPECIES: division/cell wall cluster transcriptional repressor MraZ [Sphingobium]|uniref:Transcriptional regulator MraZ n=1 Tax=Sphingobium lignivorans TaxID=2735886 RepID=A0ABR6NBD2_9SPHN|nr:MULTISPECIES: division/cell wall cluster transcriptional repressor MraZ [Sphingobium]MBB5984581.1 DNA-binding transcriptional regulator/RsmH inhibitor MraZ [Sphingobium lignivorans]
MGNGASALDGKGRFALPISFRSVLNAHSDEPGSMLVRAEPRRKCITLFGSKQVDFFQAKADETAQIALTRGDDFDPDQAAVDFWSTIKSVTIDSGGRFTLPPAFRRLYGITDGVFIVGGGRFAQIWDPERYLAESPTNPLAVEECEMFLEELRSKREGRA